MRLTILLAAAALLLAALPAAPAAVPVTYERYAITVDGETARGDLAYPSGGSPTALLVYGHGCCGKPNQSAFVKTWAGNHGAVVVAMEYRGPGGWDVMKGHRDLIGATEDLQARFPSINRTVIWGASMGGETTGMAVAARPDLYDYWVDQFGVTNLVEEWAYLGLYPNPTVDAGNARIRSWMMDETGGTPAQVPQAYADRSPVLHASGMKGIRHAYIVHGVGDPIVPYTMSREMHAALVAQGIPSSLYTILTGSGGVQGPWAPGAGFLGVPYCTTAAGPRTCVPESTCPATLPTGHRPCMVGPAAHDGRGGWAAPGIVAALLAGGEPDAGKAATEHVIDLTSGQQVVLPP